MRKIGIPEIEDIALGAALLGAGGGGDPYVGKLVAIGVRLSLIVGVVFSAIAMAIPAQIIDIFANDAPTIDCEPVKHARWEKDKDDMFWGNSFIHMRCSLCGREAHLNRFGMAYILSQFCPNCGAKMDGGKENV